MGAKKDLSFRCCPATASNPHLKEWSDCSAHLREWTITAIVWKMGWERHILLPTSIQECLGAIWQTATSDLSWKACMCAWKVSEAQQDRAARLGFVEQAKEKQEEVRDSKTLLWSFGGQKQGQWREGTHEEKQEASRALSRKAWHRSMLMPGRGGEEGGSEVLFMDPGKPTPIDIMRL